LSVGRKTRTIPAAIKRALLLRDRTCRFPGCTHSRYVDGHHIEHWANGDGTALANLMLLCTVHYTLLHEGGCRVEANGANGWKNFD
ncbi:MAG: HNH endonuclease, partial [Kofleriaceae bacterium]|nr:HNH endonuclease [Kofleriaceae bacterium]